MSDVFGIIESAMGYHSARIESAAANISNANVIQPNDGSGYKPLIVSLVEKDSKGFNPLKYRVVADLESQNSKVYSPANPLSDKDGFLHYPNIQMSNEMITLNEASRSYEANIKSFNALMNMAYKSTEIGK